MLALRNKYEKRKIAILDRIDATDYIRRCVLEIFKNPRKLTIRTRSDADHFKSVFNDPKNTTFKSMRDIQTGDPFWNRQLVDYALSNLGRGFIFYFVCNWCKRKVKYLYLDTYLDAPLCRKCSRFPYRQPTRPERKISRYLRRHPEVMARLVNSGELPIY
jgi:hypothetical protein